MDTSRSFRRILIDLDLTGGPIGAAVETWTDDRRVGLTVLERPGPFDTPLDALAAAVRWCDDRHGVQLPLFP